MMKTEIKSCEDALRLLAAHLDAELDHASEREIRKHLATCRSCYSRAEFERRLKEQVAGLRRQDVRPELNARVRTLIGEFTVAGTQ